MSLDTRTPGGQLGGGSTFSDVFYPLYQYLFDEEGDFVRSVDRKLAEARMPDNVEMFVSRALAVGTIAGLSLSLLGSFLGFIVITALFGSELPTFLGLYFPPQVMVIIEFLKLPFLVFTSGFLFGFIGFAIGFGSLIAIPYFRSSAREREINVLMSDAVSFMYALSVGGLNQLEILNAMATSEDTYGETAKEFQTIVLETQYFDTDYRTAIRNQALRTPSDELAQFLTDMLSIVNSGGDMTSFLEDQKDKQMRTARQEQKKILETLELFGEMYMTLSLFPLLLIIILVIMQMMTSGSKTLMMVLTVYMLIPLVGVAFLVLVSTITQDDPNDGFLRPESPDEVMAVSDTIDVLDFTLVDQYTGEYGVFDRIKNREGTYKVREVLSDPHLFFRDYPLTVLIVTVPISLAAVLFAIGQGWAHVSIDAIIDSPLRETFMWFYLPMYINFIPLMIFYEWNVRSRQAIVKNLSENLRKLASANDTGMTLLESIKVVSDTSSGKLSEELETMHAKVNYGTKLKQALREFNNEYHIPRLARTVKLIAEAQEASNQIQDVLTTAAQASENQDDIDRERKSRTRMQVVIIIMTYLTLLGVMALLKVQFLDTMQGLTGQVSSTSSTPGAPGSNFSSIDGGFMSMLFFHAVTLQAMTSSFIAGYIRDVKFVSGVKFAVVLSTFSLVVWMVVTNFV